MIPQPGLGVDRLTHRTEQSQAGEIPFLHRLVTLAHDRPDGGGSRVDLVDPVLVDHIPESPGVGVGGDTLEHDRGRAGTQRAVDDVGVPGHPADVGRTPVDVTVVVVENVPESGRRVDHVPAGRV